MTGDYWTSTANPMCPHGLPPVMCTLCRQPTPPAPIMGCICPPGANKDCENPLCPRKGYKLP